MFDDGATADPQRAITLRSLFFGTLGILLMSGLAGYHDSVCTGVSMIGNHMPGGAFTYILFVGLVWNGLAGRVHKPLALAPRELIVVMIMTLIACFPPTSGLFRYFHRMVMLPWYYLPGNPSWIEHGLLERLNPALFPEPVPYLDESGVLIRHQRVYQGLYTGLAQGTSRVPLGELPLGAWMRSLSYWGPLIFLCSLCVISLQFIVHQQWAHHEQLSYPVAQVARSFCDRSDGRRGVPDLFRSRLFWWGVMPVLLYYVSDFLAQWYPNSIPSPTEVLPHLKRWHVPLTEALPILRQVPNHWLLSNQGLYFTIFGLAYFVSTEIGLTMGLAPFLLALVCIVYFLVGGTPMGAEEIGVSRAGAYVGYTLILLYTGRTYFRAVFACALFNRGEAFRGSPAVLAARVLMLSFAGFILVLRWMGLDLPIALFFGLLLLLLFLVFTRIICETGIPFMQAGWMPSRLLVSLLGPAAIGPNPLVLLLWVSVILVQDPRECLMPYVATSTKLADDCGVRLKRAFGLIVGAVALAIVVAYLSSTYTQYNFSAMGDPWASVHPPQIPFNQSARLFSEMQEFQDFSVSEAAGGWSRLRMIQGDPQHQRFFAVGLLLVMVCAGLRFRFSKFPVHPVLFMLWGTPPSSWTWASFLLGWFVKMLVVRFGGGGVFQRLKPLFIGLISGELLAIGLHIVFNLLYLWINQVPSTVGVFVLPR